MSAGPLNVPKAEAGEPQLERSLRSWRSIFSAAMTTLTVGATLFAMIPLFSVLYMLITKGAQRLTPDVFVKLPPAALAPGGGFGNAIVGTLLMVGIAALISVPFGVLVGIWLAEFGGETRSASLVRFCAKVLTGIPSILAGVFAFALVVLATRRFSAVAGGMALSLLMLPTVILTAEEALKQVPRRMREAAYGIGATPSQTVLRVVLPTALPGILTGVMLAVARAAGETAPLLFTALFSEQWLKGRLLEPTASLSVLIYNFSGVPFQNQIELAWTASLVLVVIVLAVNLTAKYLTRHTGSSHMR
jgi:phosphate transport system permease protein